ncbi:MAG TPA: LysR family transcriptional regulator [Actinospica sp.]|jgi:DNA-binding transcriptional LysR family regulator|nr:LysR family transcriptional regulator [Actinospica sp.]
MTLDDLKVFTAVCRAGSLSAVAREHARTQSAVSQHVRRLERETGMPLLERQTRGVVPTEAGRLLYTAAREGIGGIELALRRIREMSQGEAGSVRVTTGATTVRHFMSEAIVEFRFRNPRVSLEFRTASSSPDCFAALAAADLDLAWITISDPVRGVEQRPVMDMPWVLAMRPGEIYADRSFVELPELSGLRLIRLPERSSSGSRLDAALTASGIGVGADAGVADWDTALLLAELGVGHAIVPALPGWPLLGDGKVRLVPLRGLPPLTVGWAMRSWTALSPPARTFAEAVTRSCQARATRPDPMSAAAEQAW